MLGIDSRTLALAIRPMWTASVRPFIPVKPKPAQRLQDDLLRLRTGPFGVRVFDSQNEFTTILPGVTIAEKRHIGRTDMGITCRRWGDSGSDFHGLICERNERDVTLMALKD